MGALIANYCECDELIRGHISLPYSPNYATSWYCSFFRSAVDAFAKSHLLDRTFSHQ